VGSVPPLAADEIHLWLMDLTLAPERLAALAATLSADEQVRAARFRFAEHRDRFSAGRGLLRELLGGYVQRPAATLRFAQGAQGKPHLVGEAAGTLHFNLAHSGERALYAVARREVGVDIEAWARRVDYAAVLERVCTPHEWAVFQSLPAIRQTEAFFACWTRKEAIAKALGGGLASGLRTLHVCCVADDACAGRMDVRDAAGRDWTVLNVPLESGWSAALAAQGADWRWRCWRWA